MILCPIIQTTPQAAALAAALAYLGISWHRAFEAGREAQGTWPSAIDIDFTVTPALAPPGRVSSWKTWGDGKEM